ncbi:hypothetical protein NDU88_004166 [Pleurodeles waltl]|uniref:Uncharacterized protein n=1 Tax=Pleurodeles waltl TaxID=8319 RepID=A0AAV7KWX2_PLEWA|nr:hypothetical protein NDU88_004166 [Pleurodeles waltl]
MTYYTDKEDFYQENPEVNEEYGMEERVVEALGTHVQDSVNQAPMKALKHFTHPLFRYGHRELRRRLLMVNMPRYDLAPDVGFAERASVGPTSLAETLAQMAASVIKNHKYDPLPSLEAAGSLPRLSTNTLDAVESGSSHSSESEHTDELKPSGKRKRKSGNIEEVNQTQRTLPFDLEAIIYQRSTKWIPCAEVVHYVQNRIRKGFNREWVV